MQPIIGITMCYDQGQAIRPGVDYSFIRREYGEEVRRAGGQPIFLDPSIDPRVAAEVCQGVIISGGEDIDPDFYGQEPAPQLGRLEPRPRTDWERRLISACDQVSRPILGICYGAQLLNVHYGGSLYQDIGSQTASQIDHGSSAAAALHRVTMERQLLGFSAGQVLESNSRHHQAVRDLAPGFEVAARADDGVIEAIVGRGHWGIQWHPESDGTAPQVYGAFVAACRSDRAVEALAPVGELA